MSDKELEAFIGLPYLRGAMNARNFLIKDMWSSRYGCDAFRKTMTRDGFMEIKKFLRFDTRNTRSDRLQDDKFCLVSFVLSRFVSNSQRNYIPEESLIYYRWTIISNKARCRFTQYMANKPDKFGITFWVLADLKTKYAISWKRWSSCKKSRNARGNVFDGAIYVGRGYNVTTDNFFTGLDLARKLQEKKHQ